MLPIDKATAQMLFEELPRGLQSLTLHGRKSLQDDPADDSNDAMLRGSHYYLTVYSGQLLTDFWLV
jgi:hypothetical protein